MNEIKNVRPMPEECKASAWENLQFAVLALTIIGQITIGAAFVVGQGLWLIANIVAVVRNIVLRRPVADQTKDCAMTALTVGIIIAYMLGAY